MLVITQGLLHLILSRGGPMCPEALQLSAVLHEALWEHYPGPPSFPGGYENVRAPENLLALKYEKKTAELELINVLLCIYKT